tara:strand:- start:78 stop:350 length:273 start_codon:yes stop_codon:yes gene_type:complete
LLLLLLLRLLSNGCSASRKRKDGERIEGEGRKRQNDDGRNDGSSNGYGVNGFYVMFHGQQSNQTINWSYPKFEYFTLENIYLIDRVPKFG